MPSFMEQYGAGEERRSRAIWRIVGAALVIAVLIIVGYFLFHNYSEKKLVKHFASQLNAKQFEEAYRSWGCSEANPCRDYSFQSFMEDWGPNKAKSEWKITSVDGCPTGVIVTLSAGQQPAPLWIDRGGNTIGFSPWPECQGKRWRWQQFFKNVF